MFELLHVLLPELLGVARTPIQFIGLDLLVVFLEGRQNSVVAFQHFGQLLEVVFQLLVLDVFSQFVVHYFEQVVVDHQLHALVPFRQILC